MRYKDQNEECTKIVKSCCAINGKRSVTDIILTCKFVHCCIKLSVKWNYYRPLGRCSSSLKLSKRKRDLNSDKIELHHEPFVKIYDMDKWRIVNVGQNFPGSKFRAVEENSTKEVNKIKLNVQKTKTSIDTSPSEGGTRIKFVRDGSWKVFLTKHYRTQKTVVSTGH